MTPTMFGKCFWSDMHQRFNVTEKSSSDQLKSIHFEKAVEKISKGQKYLVWTVIFVVLECPVLKLTMSSEKKGGEEKSGIDDQTSRSGSI